MNLEELQAALEAYNMQGLLRHSQLEPDHKNLATRLLRQQALPAAVPWAVDEVISSYQSLQRSWRYLPAQASEAVSAAVRWERDNFAGDIEPGSLLDWAVRAAG